MRAVILEGSPEEIGKAIADFLPSETSAVALASEKAAKVATSEEEDDDEEEAEFIDYDVATEALNRRPLGDSQITLLKELAEAHPNYVTAHQLMSVLDMESAQFRGLMGAFGRRLAYTDGHEEGTAFFDQEWVDDLACYQYRLPEAVYEAVKDAGVLD